MADLSEEIDEAEKEIGRAITKYVELKVKRDHEYDSPPFVASWAVYTEYLTVDDVNNSTSIGLNIFPRDQLPSTSRGLFHFGADRFQTAKLNPN